MSMRTQPSNVYLVCEGCEVDMQNNQGAVISRRSNLHSSGDQQVIQW